MLNMCSFDPPQAPRPSHVLPVPTRQARARTSPDSDGSTLPEPTASGPTDTSGTSKRSSRTYFRTLSHPLDSCTLVTPPWETGTGRVRDWTRGGGQETNTPPPSIPASDICISLFTRPSFCLYPFPATLPTSLSRSFSLSLGSSVYASPPPPLCLCLCLSVHLYLCLSLYSCLFLCLCTPLSRGLYLGPACLYVTANRDLDQPLCTYQKGKFRPFLHPPQPGESKSRTLLPPGGLHPFPRAPPPPSLSPPVSL